MTRPRIALFLAALAVLVAIPAALILANAVPRTESSPAAISSVQPDRSTGPIAIRPGNIAWVYSPMPIVGINDGSFVLQAGTLDHDAPLLDIAVQWPVDLEADLVRVPAVGPPIDGSVVYVEDTGAASIVHLAEIADGGADEEVAEMADVVWDLVVAPDNSVAYAAITDRATRENDLGVVRVDLDGSGRIEQVMAGAGLGVRPGTVLAAFIGLNVQLWISDDGRHVVRQVCSGSSGCAVDVLDAESGRVDAGGRNTVVAVGGDFMFTSGCDAMACSGQAIDLDTGQGIEMPLEPPFGVSVADGRTFAITPFSDEEHTIDAIDVRTGDRSVVFRVPREAWGTLDLPFDLALGLPAGHIHVTVSREVPGNGAVVETRNQELVISILDGQVTEIPFPPIRPVPGFGLQG